MSQDNDTPPPLLQRFYDSPLMLTIVGTVVMLGVYTIWGVVEIMTLPQATLP